jgi:E3 ubiquitin-protein ligase UBR4
VAFQCRKCRHINYDRLDAFLCVECGYCASGSFSLEINAAVASNAIAIVSDKEHSRAMKILGAVNTLHDAVKAALMEKIKEIDKQSKESAHTMARDGTFDTNLDLALLGLPHLVEAGKASKSTGSAFMDRIDKPGSLVRMAARPESLQDSGRSAAPGDRTQSLLRLARQIRSESGMAWDRRRSGDLLIRHLGRGIAVDTVEGQRNLIGLLEDGNVLDSADTLGRAIAGARASARGDRLAAMGSPGRPSEGAPGDASSLEQHARKGKKLSVKETLDECERLHSLMREAQKERYKMKRRIHAWEKLNEGYLVDTGHPLGDDDEIDKCHCSGCGPAVAFNLLNLWAHLFAARPRQVRVDVDFLSMLLTDSAQVGKTLADRMRDTVTNIATESEDGARLVLSQIRRRLLATSDPVSAEILGKIMGVEGHFLGDEYAKLAMDLLSQRQG